MHAGPTSGEYHNMTQEVAKICQLATAERLKVAAANRQRRYAQNFHQARHQRMAEAKAKDGIDDPVRFIKWKFRDGVKTQSLQTLDERSLVVSAQQ